MTSFLKSQPVLFSSPFALTRTVILFHTIYDFIRFLIGRNFRWHDFLCVKCNLFLNDLFVDLWKSVQDAGWLCTKHTFIASVRNWDHGWAVSLTSSDGAESKLLISFVFTISKQNSSSFFIDLKLLRFYIRVDIHMPFNPFHATDLFLPLPLATGFLMFSGGIERDCGMEWVDNIICFCYISFKPLSLSTVDFKSEFFSAMFI